MNPGRENRMDRTRTPGPAGYLPVHRPRQPLRRTHAASGDSRARYPSGRQPEPGPLLGLSARGARVVPGACLVEVDPMFFDVLALFVFIPLKLHEKRETLIGLPLLSLIWQSFTNALWLDKPVEEWQVPP